MTVTDVVGVAPEVAAYVGVPPSCEPLGEIQVQELRKQIFAVVAADDSLASFPDLRKFDNALLDAVSDAMRLVVAQGGGEELVARAKEKLDAIPSLCRASTKRKHSQQSQETTKVCHSSSYLHLAGVHVDVLVLASWYRVLCLLGLCGCGRRRRRDVVVDVAAPRRASCHGMRQRAFLLQPGARVFGFFLADAFFCARGHQNGGTSRSAVHMRCNIKQARKKKRRTEFPHKPRVLAVFDST